jgi:gamma-glutamyltranspeptidase/glutathione hydrolase
MAMGLNGIVVTPHALASAEGLRVLRDGGNAIDACVAAGAVLGVVCPAQCGIGGDLFAIISPARGDDPFVLNASGRAGTRATPDVVRSFGHERMPDKGPLSAVTPGCVAGWQAALERFGTRDLGSLLTYAQSLAQDGFPVDRHLASGIRNGLRHFNDAARETFAPGGSPPGIRDILRQPDLGRTLQRIAQDGPKVMYDGPVGQEVGAYLARVGGHHEAGDLADYAPEWTTPVQTDFRGFTVCAPAPNSQGLLYLLALAILDPLDLGDPLSARATHLQIEAIGFALESARAAIADPRFEKVPTERLLSAAHAAAGRAQITAAREPSPVRPVSAGDTVYFCAADRDGNVVSMIQSHRQGFGSGVLVPGTGVLLNNRARDFGLRDDDPNCIAPGKRPRHTLSPGMALRNGRPVFAYGTRGGDGQPYTMVQLSCDLLASGMDPQAAQDAPRWTVEQAARGPKQARIALEPSYPAQVGDALTAMGHPVVVTSEFLADYGTASILQLDQRGVFLGGADPRGDGIALAF